MTNRPPPKALYEYYLGFVRLHFDLRRVRSYMVKIPYKHYIPYVLSTFTLALVNRWLVCKRNLFILLFLALDKKRKRLDANNI
jgi:hypothetical protein